MTHMIKRVGICGSGIMGSGIAEVAAKAGFDVVLRSRHQATADATIAGLEKSLQRQVDKGRLSEEDRDAVLGRVSGTERIADLADCDLVIESVVEDLATKKALFLELDHAVKAGAILATNTSTLPVIEMAVETGRADRFCGIHFFNPAPAMSLVEVVRPLTASDETIAQAKQFAADCGKNPVEVADRAGFIVNALLFPYLNNAVRMLENGTASRDDIDTAMKGDSTRRSPSSTPSTTSSATRTTRRFRSCVAWSRPATSVASPAEASTTTSAERRHRSRRARPIGRALV